MIRLYKRRSRNLSSASSGIFCSAALARASPLGVKVEYGEPISEGEYKGTFKTVSDKEHAEMIRIYIEEGLGTNKIAEILGRSSRTSLVQVHKHNSAVERSGFCPACRKARSKHESQTALRA